MRNKLLPLIIVIATTLVPAHSYAQTDWSEVFNTLKLEARADAQGCYGKDMNALGFAGRYFDLKMGGNLGGGFSYFFRQNIRANSGDISFFDNTDFLWLNYQVNDQWRLRFGKDAMAVGGYEYDAAPIDEYFTSVYWDNIYCFQLAVSAAYTTQDGRQTFVGQVSQSPYLNSLKRPWDAGLFSFNLEWMGTLGERIHTLWSTSMIMRDREHFTPKFMNLTMLGTQLVMDNWDIYIDLMHHALATDDWGNNFGVVARFNYSLTHNWSLFAKGSYEQNHSELDFLPSTTISVDNMVPAGHSYAKYGAGFEFHPKGLSSVRLHGYLAGLMDNDGNNTRHGICANLGATWILDVHKMLQR